MPVTAAWHRQALDISTRLTRTFYRMRGTQTIMADADEVIRLLNEANVRFVVMGTHGLNGFRSQPRATEDVDILVRKRDHKKAVGLLQQAYPGLRVVDGVAETRFVDMEARRVLIDLMKPDFNVSRTVFRNTVPVGEEYRVPSLEMNLVAKYVAMTALNRNPAKRLVDAGDFTDLVQHNRDALDLKKLRRLADAVRGRGGDEILALVEQIDDGQVIQVPTDS